MICGTDFHWLNLHPEPISKVIVRRVCAIYYLCFQTTLILHIKENCFLYLTDIILSVFWNKYCSKGKVHKARTTAISKCCKLLSSLLTGDVGKLNGGLNSGVLCQLTQGPLAISKIVGLKMKLSCYSQIEYLSDGACLTF